VQPDCDAQVAASKNTQRVLAPLQVALVAHAHPIALAQLAMSAWIAQGEGAPPQIPLLQVHPAISWQLAIVTR
jgi:hypothetical protein